MNSLYQVSQSCETGLAQSAEIEAGGLAIGVRPIITMTWHFRSTPRLACSGGKFVKMG